MQKQIFYRFSIKSITLVNSKCPLDFKLMIKQQQNGEVYQSPIVKPENLCHQQFPWQFSLLSNLVVIYFIELSDDRKNRIIQAVNTLELHEDNSEKQLKMLTKRSGKQICTIIYSSQLQEQESSNSSINESTTQIKQDNNKISNLQTGKFQDEKQKTQRSQNKVIFSKEDHLVLTEQIKVINQSISKMLNESEQMENSRYLDGDEPNSQYILKLNGVIENQTQNEYKMEQSYMDQSPISLKWYQEKYQKSKPNRQIKLYPKQAQGMKKFQPSLQYSNDYLCDGEKLQLSDLSFSGDIKPKYILIKEELQSEPIVKIVCPQSYGYQWNSIILLPKVLLLQLTVIDQDLQKKLYGCLTSEQNTTGKILLYNNIGETKAVMKFKGKILKMFSVQTMDFLNTIEEQRQNIYEEDKQLSPIEEMGKKQVQINISTQTERVVKQKEPIKSEKLLENLRVPGKIRSLHKQKHQNQEINNMNKPKDKIPSSIENQKIFFETPKKGRYNEIIQNQKQKNIKSFQIVSNSYSMAYTPLEKIPSMQLQRKRNSLSYIYDEGIKSQARSVDSMASKTVSFKIDNLSVKLDSEIDSFVGKFLKLHIKGRQPFVTQKISLSKNLNWKGKGYIFEKVPIYSQLLINVYSDCSEGPKLYGSTRICLALLSLNETSKIIHYHDYVRDMEMQQIGTLILGYQSLKKDPVSKRRNIRTKKHKTQQTEGGNSNIKYSKLKSNKIGSDRYWSSSNSKALQEKKKIGVESSVNKYIAGSSSSIRNKKYTGGNIIIGRAARFKGLITKDLVNPQPSYIPSRPAFVRNYEY